MKSARREKVSEQTFEYFAQMRINASLEVAVGVWIRKKKRKPPKIPPLLSIHITTLVALDFISNIDTLAEPLSVDLRGGCNAFNQSCPVLRARVVKSPWEAYILSLMLSPRSRLAGGGVRVLLGVKTPLFTSQAAVLNSEKRVLMRQPNLFSESGIVSRMAVPTTGLRRQLVSV